MLEKKFNNQDIETLIEAMEDWEAVGNQEYHILSMIKSAPMPPSDHEAFEYMDQIKQYFKKREKDIMASKSIRQEKSIFLKAKLLMLRQDLQRDEFLEIATTNIENNNKFSEKENKINTKESEIKKKLDMAEFFIKDLGVWSHFEKFLAEKSKTA